MNASKILKDYFCSNNISTGEDFSLWQIYNFTQSVIQFIPDDKIYEFTLNFPEELIVYLEKDMKGKFNEEERKELNLNTVLTIL